MSVFFRSEAQRNETCATLCQWTGHAALWSLWPGAGPTDRALQLLKADGPRGAPGESAAAQIAVALWEGRGELRFGDLLPEFEREARRAIDALLEALLSGPEAIDDWVEEHGREGTDADATSAQRARTLRHVGTL
jgi:hypothetical protein